MTLLDLRREADDAGETALWSYSTEHALLGVVLFENDALHAIPPVPASSFREGAHALIWTAIAGIIAEGAVAEPSSVLRRIGENQALDALGGIRFLADLVLHAPPASAAEHLAVTVNDLAHRRAVLAATETAARDLRGGQRTGEIIEALESGLLAAQRGTARAGVLSAEEAVRDMLEDLSAPPGSEGGVLTGLAPLDDHLGRLQPEELILIAGRPGSGKSALGACIALNVARTGVGVIEINSEMSTRQMMRRHVADLCFGKWGHAAPTYRDLKRRTIQAQQWQMVEWAAREIGRLPLAMVKQTGLNLAALRSLVRRQVYLWNAKGIAAGLVCVDHAGLLEAESRGRDRYTDQTSIAIGMKALAGELKVPLICMVQLSRKVEDRDNKRPQLWDLRDTGAWEENADTAIGLYREAYYANKEPEPKESIGKPASSERLADWERRKLSKAVEAGLMKVREGEEATIKLWASIGHNAIRGADPDGGGFL